MKVALLYMSIFKIPIPRLCEKFSVFWGPIPPPLHRWRWYLALRSHAKYHPIGAARCPCGAKTSQTPPDRTNYALLFTNYLLLQRKRKQNKGSLHRHTHSEQTQSQTDANNLGTNLAFNHRQFIIVAAQFLVHKARVEVIARTLEIIPGHKNSASLYFGCRLPSKQAKQLHAR